MTCSLVLVNLTLVFVFRYSNWSVFVLHKTRVVRYHCLTLTAKNLRNGESWTLPVSTPTLRKHPELKLAMASHPPWAMADMDSVVQLVCDEGI